MKSIAVIILLLSFSQIALSQEPSKILHKPLNLYSFSTDKQSYSTELNLYSNEKTHPEFGVLPFNAGCYDCFEIIEKRTAEERYFLKENTNGNAFTIQKSYMPMHFKNNDGLWITIDSRLKKIEQKKYSATQQPFPTEIDLESGLTTLMGQQKIIFNKDVKLFYTTGKKMLNSQFSSNEVFFTAGDEGVEQRNFFPGIYRQLIVNRGSIKTNYILIKKPEIVNHAKWFMIEDNFLLPENYYIKADSTGTFNSNGIWFGDLLIINDSSLEEFRIIRPQMFDDNISNDDDEALDEIGYKFFKENKNWKLQLYVSVEWIANKNRDYPVTIDPTVTVSGSYLPIVYEGSGYANGTWTNTNCSYPINLIFPANAAATNAGFTAQYSTDIGCSNCYIENGGFNIVGPCGISQEVVGLPWTCQGAPVTGSCAESSVAVPQIISCLTPSCNPIPVEISLQLMRIVCPGGGCLNTCIRLDPNEFNVTISGTTPATLTSNFTVTSPVCEMQSSTFTYTGNGNSGSTYNWNFGGGSIVSGSGLGPYQISWALAGTKTVRLIVIDNGCISDTFFSTVVVKDIPSSAFSYGTACEGTNTQIIYGGGFGTGASFIWTFGGGTIASGSGEGPYNIVWNTAGTYTVTLTTTLLGCVSPTTTHQITVLQSPSSAFTVESPACAGGGTVVNYIGNANINAPYNWYFGGGLIISGGGQGPWVISYLNPGNYNITLIVQDFGCTSTMTSNTVVVNAIPTADFLLPTDICEGINATITYSGTVSINTIYNWNFGGGTVASGSGAGPYEVFWNTPGNHSVSLTVEIDSCTSPIVYHNINVMAAPQSSFTVTSPICADTVTTIIFTGSVTANAVFNWNFGSATILSGSGAGPYILSFSSDGTFPVSLTITDNGCTAMYSHDIIVNEIPTSVFTVSPISACQNSIIDVVYTGTGDNTSTYNWNFDSAFVSIGNAIGPYEISYSDTGNYFVSLYVTHLSCISDTQINSIQVNPKPTAAFDAAPLYACDELKTFFVNNSTGATNYTWNFGDNSIDTSVNPVHLFQVGLYDVSLVISNEFGCMDSIGFSNYINVQPTPAVQFTSNPPEGIDFALNENHFVFDNLTQDGTSYIWFFGDEDSSEIFNPVHFYSDTGTYYVTLIAFNDVGCSDTISHGPFLIVKDPLIFIPSAFTPNGDGINDLFKIFGKTIRNTSMRIYNRWGEIIYDGDAYRDGWDGTFNDKKLNSGVYIYNAVITKNSGLTITLQGDLTLLK